MEAQPDEQDTHLSRRERHRSRSASPSEDRCTKRKRSLESYGSKGKESTSGNSTSWVRPLLRVRFIDRAYKSGKYYNSKLIIEDVINSRLCVCRTDSGRILDDVPEKWLETLIPKKHPFIVMIVKGAHSGQLGEILEKEKGSCVATVQLLQDKDVIQLDYDSICEYSGTVSDFD